MHLHHKPEIVAAYVEDDPVAFDDARILVAGLHLSRTSPPRSLSIMEPCAQRLRGLWMFRPEIREGFALHDPQGIIVCCYQFGNKHKFVGLEVLTAFSRAISSGEPFRKQSRPRFALESG